MIKDFLLTLIFILIIDTFFRHKYYKKFKKFVWHSHLNKICGYYNDFKKLSP